MFSKYAADKSACYLAQRPSSPDATSPRSHYPDQRHVGQFNVLYCDGHSTGLTESALVELGVSAFLTYGDVPVFP